MSKIAILIGIYSYLIYFLGIFKLLNPQNVLLITGLYFVFLAIILIKLKINFKRKFPFKSRINFLLFALLLIQLSIYSIGTLGPELGFDALWYHLTIPKIFIASNMIFHIPGNLFYYSDMPKLVDILYIPGLMFGNEILTKIIHFIFGVLALTAFYNLSRKFFSEKLSLLSTLVLSSNLVFAWELNTSYVDLAWLFFEILSLTYFIQFIKTKSIKNLLFLGVFVGLSVCVKLSAISSIFIYSTLLLVVFYFQKNKLTESLKFLFLFIFTNIIIVFPSLIVPYLNTGNPFYPLFTKSISFTHTFDLLSFIKVWFFNPDPINPLYLMSFPLLFIVFKKFNFINRLIFLYCLLSLIAWYILGQIGGTRYLLPYLSGFSILVILVYNHLELKMLKNVLFALLIFIAISSTFYRLAANIKYISFIAGLETKDEFLAKHLNFSFGDFYDTDNFFKDNLGKNETVLTVGFHNLYYANFNFIDYSYLKKGDKFKYIAVQNTLLPKEFKDWKLIHTNLVTNVKIYSK